MADHTKRQPTERTLHELGAALEEMRQAIARARPYVEAVALSRETGHLQADADLRFLDEVTDDRS